MQKSKQTKAKQKTLHGLINIPLFSNLVYLFHVLHSWWFWICQFVYDKREAHAHSSWGCVHLTRSLSLMKSSTPKLSSLSEYSLLPNFLLSSPTSASCHRDAMTLTSVHNIHCFTWFFFWLKNFKGLDRQIDGRYSHKAKSCVRLS